MIFDYDRRRPAEKPPKFRPNFFKKILTRILVNAILMMTRKIVKIKRIIVKQIAKEAAMVLKNNLKEHRARLNLNQSEMGVLAGVSRQTISQIERGDYSPSVTLALRIARICGVSVEEIFRLEDE